MFPKLRWYWYIYWYFDIIKIAYLIIFWASKFNYLFMYDKIYNLFLFIIIIKMSFFHSNITYHQHCDEITNRRISNVLSSFMSSNPQKIPLFAQKKLSNDVIIFYSQLNNDCSICLKKLVKPCKINACHHIFLQKMHFKLEKNF